MKKILYLVQLPPPVHGVAVMNQILLDSKSINQTYSTSTVPLRFTNKIKEIGTFSVTKVFKLIGLCGRLIMALIKRPHLVYFTLTPSGGAFYRDLILVALLKLFGRKIIYHLHGSGLKNRYQAGGRLDRFFLKMAFRNVAVICLSQRMTEDLTPVYVNQPFIVPNGLLPAAIEPNYSTNSVLRIIYLSNLIKEKGILDFLEAIRSLRDMNISVEASIVGEDFDITSETVQSFIDQNDLPHCKLLGGLYGRDKSDILAGSDVLILPTYNDSFPLVILEAMQAGMVVISTTVGGIPDLIDDGNSGFVVEPGDVSRITQIVADLSTNPERLISIKKNAYQRFKSNFTSAHFEKNMLKVFGQIIG